MAVPSFTLNDGTKIPAFGIGSWMGVPGGGERVYDMCIAALKQGYRLLDTAAGYGNEEHVGRAVRDSGVPRSEVYITTKLANFDHHRVQEAFEESLKNLNCEYIDLYLMHWPQASLSKTFSVAGMSSEVPPPGGNPTFIDTWKDMEKLLSTGKVRTIGVSNFSISTLTELLPHCNIIPAVNQVELHPLLPSMDLKKFCESKGILLEAYSPLGQKSTVIHESPVTREIADKHHVSSAQVALSWGVQRGTVVIVKTEKESRMKENISLIQLTDEDMEILNNMHNQPGMHRSLVWAGDTDQVFGWKYEWLGWEISKGGIVP